MELTEAQYLILNALDTLELLLWRIYDEDRGVWCIYTPSPVLHFAIVSRNGDITLFRWEEDEN